jgi:ParB family transcriptional regulator, chromosome partitioning protein
VVTSEPGNLAPMQLEIHQLDRRYERLRTRSPRRERRLLASLSESGQQVPIVVVRSSEPDRYVVVDGFKRVRALVRLGEDLVDATCWQLSETEALIVERLLSGSGKPSALEQGWLLREMVERFALGASELARRFDRSVSWVSRRLGLVRDLPEAVQERVRAGEVVPHAAMKYLLPLARANASDCVALLAGLRGARPSSRAMGRLYVAYMAGDARTRERLVSDPLLFLRVDEERQRKPSDAAEQLLADLRAALAIVRRVRRLLEQWPGEPLCAQTRGQASVLLGRARAELEKLRQLWPEEDGDAGRADAAGDPAAARSGTRDADDRPGAAHLAGGGARRAHGGHRHGPADAALVTG